MLSIVIGIGLLQLDPGWDKDKSGRNNNITLTSMPLRFIGLGIKFSNQTPHTKVTTPGIR